MIIVRVVHLITKYDIVHVISTIFTACYIRRKFSQAIKATTGEDAVIFQERELSNIKQASENIYES